MATAESTLDVVRPDCKQAALSYGRRGVPVFPCSSDKRPLTTHGFKDATVDPEQIKAWWRQWPDALIGMPTGEKTRLLVVDVDTKPGVDGEASLAALVKQHGPLPDTRVSRTKSGGRHLYFRHVEGIGNSAGRLGPGLDVRGDGGYVIVAPSPGYSWTNEAKIAASPAWLADLLRKPKNEQAVPLATSLRQTVAGDGTRYGLAALDGILAEMRNTPEGQRNATLNKLAFRVAQLVAGGELAESAGDALKDAALSAGLSAHEINQTFASGFKNGWATRPRVPKPVAKARRQRFHPLHPKPRP